VPQRSIGYFKSVQEFFVNRISYRASLGAVAAASVSLFPALAQTAPANAAPQTLTFNVNARLSSNGGSTQNMAARVLAKGNRVRIETKMGERDVVFLAAPPYLYKLIPSSKAGVRWKSTQLNDSRFDVASLFNPTAIRQQLRTHGAKAVGSQVLNGVRTDVFQAKKAIGGGTNIKAWLRRDNTLPLRIETRSKSLSSVVSWSNYRRNAALPASLFKVPAGYNVRESQGKPGLF
jgi:hypothetical protein